MMYILVVVTFRTENRLDDTPLLLRQTPPFPWLKANAMWPLASLFAPFRNEKSKRQPITLLYLTTL